MIFQPFPREFYEPSARLVARRLLGHWLIRMTPEGPCGGAIVETEAYLRNDPSAHSYVGPTNRNRVMFGPPGHGYVYFIYGNHYCVNAVCLPEGTAEAVLIRAVQADFGEELLRHRRPVTELRQLTSGPAKLCEAMGIDRSLDGVDLCDPASSLIIVPNPNRIALIRNSGPIVTTTRIGITKAAEMPLRFYLSASPFVSRK